ncbi:hypothetical protein LCGC14_3041940 [marine sediment metagenome]|uniref:Uncharacterized protein n=1 Tax=marine sediment metagenome TaxID=412755 RepID=A0A0F8YX98_9ZZZZ
MGAISELKAVLLGQNGTVSISGSDEDREIISRSLAEIEKQLDLFVYEILQLKKTGVKDNSGVEISEGNTVRLDFETVHLQGVVRRAENGEWELYESDSSHVGIHHNRGRLTVVDNVEKKQDVHGDILGGDYVSKLLGINP